MSRCSQNETHTRYVVDVTASEYDHVEGAQLGSWPTGSNDTATLHRNATVSLAFDPMTYYDDQPKRKETLNGTVIATDAQTFGTLQFTPGGDSTDPSLSLRVAGPHYKPNGTVNDGYYEAFLPTSLLDSWGISDPSTLEAAYQNNATSITAASVSGGLYVDIPIHYSSGTVKLTPNTDSNDGSDGFGALDDGTSGDDTTDDGNASDENTPPKRRQPAMETRSRHSTIATSRPITTRTKPNWNATSRARKRRPPTARVTARPDSGRCQHWSPSSRRRCLPRVANKPAIPSVFGQRPISWSLS